MLLDNLSVIKIVVQIQIRLGNIAWTVALQRALAKFQIISYIIFFLTISSHERRGIAIIFFDSLAISRFRSLLYFKLQLSWRIKLCTKQWVYFFQFPFLSGYQWTFQPLKRISTVDLQNWTHQLTRNMLCFYSFYFIMQGKLIILRTRCFLHQNKSQFQWLKDKTLLQSKFC